MTVIKCVTFPDPEGLAVLAFCGDLDAAAVPEMRAVLDSAVGARLAILDLSDVGSIDAAGLDVLIEGIRAVRGQSGQGVVLARPGQVLGFLDSAELNSLAPVLPAYDDGVLPMSVPFTGPFG